MSKFMNFMEEKFVPVAGKISSQKHLVAVRDAFACTVPVMLVGAICVMFVNVFFSNTGLLSTWIDAPSFFENTNKYLVPIFQKIVDGSIQITSLLFAMGLAYNRAKQEGMDIISNQVIVVGALIVMGFSNFFTTAGIFVTLIMGLVLSEINFFVVRKKWVIKMPDSVPPAVGRAFSALVPGMFVLIIASTITFLFSFITINDAPATMFSWFKAVMQEPLNALGSSFVSVLILAGGVPFFWFFGIHGAQMLAPILDTVYVPFTNDNMVNYLAGARTIEDGLHVWTRLSFDIYGKMGGGGSTLCLLVAILIVGKLKNERAVANMALAPGIFNINEPVTFGVPMVLNFAYAIPFIFVPVVQCAIAYLATAAGIVAPVVNNIPWTVPVGLGAFLATNGDFMAVLLCVVNFIVGVLFYLPFVMISNRVNAKNDVQ